jgi:hypothetical protein
MHSTRARGGGGRERVRGRTTKTWPLPVRSLSPGKTLCSVSGWTHRKTKPSVTCRAVREYTHTHPPAKQTNKQTRIQASKSTEGGEALDKNHGDQEKDEDGGGDQVRHQGAEVAGAGRVLEAGPQDVGGLRGRGDAPLRRAGRMANLAGDGRRRMGAEGNKAAGPADGAVARGLLQLLQLLVEAAQLGLPMVDGVHLAAAAAGSAAQRAAHGDLRAAWPRRSKQGETRGGPTPPKPLLPGAGPYGACCGGRGRPRRGGPRPRRGRRARRRAAPCPAPRRRRRPPPRQTGAPAAPPAPPRWSPRAGRARAPSSPSRRPPRCAPGPGSGWGPGSGSLFGVC